jgi:broad specificity phosphatase PhoE
LKSKTKKIYIIRHGETDFNRLGIVQGSGVDSELNDLGNMQAYAFYEYYKNVSFDKIYTSKLKRTHQSVKYFIEKKINWEQHHGLNEICWGNREGKLPDENDTIYFEKVINHWQDGNLEISFEGGESPIEVAKRQTEFLNLIISQENEKNILIAMHGRALRIFLANIIDNNLAKMDKYEHTNLCLYLLNYSYKTKSFTIELSCDTTHLNALNIAQ